MIRHMGYKYTVKLDVPVEVTVIAHSGDAAEEEAVRIVEEALKAAGIEADAGVWSTERGDEALDVTEDDD